ncbi:hypothetical protein OH76DRAFT_473318 [Lentinus brumalis]|uniref:Uncharacterized protein n=1 Tax=Lentinus brumalis TaxID=2498619 RepID=A0A371DD08_9APHY|nr:hypothetical protein OH76DRAFT_473318 [Polyporus brumalis]
MYAPSNLGVIAAAGNLYSCTTGSSFRALLCNASARLRLPATTGRATSRCPPSTAGFPLQSSQRTGPSSPLAPRLLRRVSVSLLRSGARSGNRAAQPHPRPLRYGAHRGSSEDTPRPPAHLSGNPQAGGADGTEYVAPSRVVADPRGRATSRMIACSPCGTSGVDRGGGGGRDAAVRLSFVQRASVVLPRGWACCVRRNDTIVWSRVYSTGRLSTCSNLQRPTYLHY